MGIYKLDDLNVLVLNTNMLDDKSVACVGCGDLMKILNSVVQLERTKSWHYTYGSKQNILTKNQKLSVIVAHQPLYDICEHARLPYGAETQTTDFLSGLQDFIDGNGIYLCGDKHTSSIAASFIHDIPHFLCGHPFVSEKNNICSNCEYNTGTIQNGDIEIDYNLIEIFDGKIGQTRKIHLTQNETNVWKCQILPIDSVVADLYETSKKFIAQNSFMMLETQSGIKYGSCINLSWRNVSKYLQKWINSEDIKNLSAFYRLFCRLKNESDKMLSWDENINIFEQMIGIITEMMSGKEYYYLQNMINFRGDYSSGKSTFLGLLYMYMLYQYSCGEINYIPAYFNIENEDILNQVQVVNTYAKAVKEIFSSFVNRIEDIAKKDHVDVCYIIDGLDEQDIWSESSQDSIGRVVLDVMAETKNFKYMMAFCQNNLPQFKNTMSTRKYYEKSYVMYFNPVRVKEKNDFSNNFVSFVRSITALYKQEKENGDSINSDIEPKECEAIRKLRRLQINPGFIYHNYQYLKEYKESDTIDKIYKEYIDQQHQICVDALGYNYIHYAPVMAYLFTYEGYTYEKFKNISTTTSVYWEKKILEYSDKIYITFIFIKKHKDAREYLLAVHYNRELRYYAENPNIEIYECSIVNKLIPRNISIIIRKLWRDDQNKFVIVCRNLIEKRKLYNMKPLNNCILSMLTYVLGYLDGLPDYKRGELKKLLFDYNAKLNGEMDSLQKSGDIWEITGNDSERMKKFIDLNFWHSQEIFLAINENSSISLVKKILRSPSLVLYNRQYMMWYYGDLTIYGENRRNNLVPGKDIVNKGVEYYYSFHTLYCKIHEFYECECAYSYPLLEFDLFTIFDLVCDRLMKKINVFNEANQVNSDFNNKILELLQKYIENYQKANEVEESKVYSNFEKMNSTFLRNSGTEKLYKQISNELDENSAYNDKSFAYWFFAIAKIILTKLL